MGATEGMFESRQMTSGVCQGAGLHLQLGKEAEMEWCREGKLAGMSGSD